MAASKYKHPLSHYCKVYGIAIATAKRYSQRGLPLDDPEAMKIHLASRIGQVGRPVEELAGADVAQPLPAAPPVEEAKRKAPREKKEAKPKEPKDALAKNPFKRNSGVMLGSLLSAPGSVKRGGAEALKRLAEDEAALWSKLDSMQREAEPNLVQAALLRDAWLRTCESLRKYELAIEESRRASGELISRAEAEDSIRIAANWLRLAAVGYLRVVPPRVLNLVSKANQAKQPTEDIVIAIFTLLKEALGDQVAATIEGAGGTSTPMKPWAQKAALEGFQRDT